MRNNANGVDLNRNFDSFWSHTEPGAGASPFSEHETSVLKGYALEFLRLGDEVSPAQSGEALLERDGKEGPPSSPSLFLTLHSGQQAMFMPNAGTNEPHRNAAGCRVLKALNDHWPTVRNAARRGAMPRLSHTR